MRNWRSEGLTKISEGRKRDESADIQLMKEIEKLAIQAGLREEAPVIKIPSQIKIELESKAAEEDVLKADGSRELTAPWDIGEDQSILAERFDARDAGGLKLYSEDEGTRFWIFNNSIISREVNAIATYEMERYDTTPAANEIGIWAFRSKNSLGNTLRYAGIRAFATDVAYDSPDGLLRFEVLANSQNIVHMTMTGGKVGIGTGTPPNRKLEVADSTAPQLRLSYNATYYTDFQAQSQGNLVITPSGGKVGIGTITPERELHIAGPTTWLRIDRSHDTYGPAMLFVRKNASEVIQKTWLFGPTNTAGAAGNSFCIIDYGQYVSGNYGTVRFLIGANTGNIGIGTKYPDRKLDVLDASDPQLRLTHTDGSIFTDFQTENDGDLSIEPSGSNINIIDKNLLLGTTDGTQIGTAASQKLALWGATPVVQPATVADPTGGGTIDAEARTAIIAIIDRLQEAGVIA